MAPNEDGPLAILFLPKSRRLHLSFIGMTLVTFLIASPVLNNHFAKHSPSSLCLGKLLKQRVDRATAGRWLFMSSVRRPISPGDTLRGKFLPTAFDMENSALSPNEIGSNEDDNMEAIAEREKQGVASIPFSRDGLKPADRIFWNRHSRAAKLRWENDENFRKRKISWLRTGAETRKLKHSCKEKSKAQKKRDYTLSEEGRARKREKLQKRHRNFVEWMQERLDSGEELRRRIYDNDYKKELQMERSRIAKERHRRRQDKISINEETVEEE